MLDIYAQADGLVPGHDAVYVGDVKLSDFRASFAKSNFNVQFDQGAHPFLFMHTSNITLQVC
jgi:hypothetical protein